MKYHLWYITAHEITFIYFVSFLTKFNRVRDNSILLYGGYLEGKVLPTPNTKHNAALSIIHIITLYHFKPVVFAELQRTVIFSFHK